MNIPLKADLSVQLGMLILDVGDVILTVHGGFKRSRLDPKERKIAFTLETDDIDTSVSNLHKLGVALIGPIENTPVHRFQMLEDPWGNLVEIGQYK